VDNNAWEDYAAKPRGTQDPKSARNNSASGAAGFFRGFGSSMGRL
jgi:hypothetical protein